MAIILIISYRFVISSMSLFDGRTLDAETEVTRHGLGVGFPSANRSFRLCRGYNSMTALFMLSENPQNLREEEIQNRLQRMYAISAHVSFV
jgi:hypothetical protein